MPASASGMECIEITKSSDSRLARDAVPSSRVINAPRSRSLFVILENSQNLATWILFGHSTCQNQLVAFPIFSIIDNETS